jgi:HPt (histidine-containing phosphotransfer) domain-containing protein
VARRDLTGAVDFGHLEIFAAGDGALIDEVLSLFREQAAVWMRLLDPNGDPGAFRDAAHTLKGASLGVGAFALAKACEAGEGGFGQDAGRRAVLASRVRDELDKALADIAAYAHERMLQSLKG